MQLSKPTILVIDDDIEILNLLIKALQKDGFEILTADESRKAVEIFRQHWREIELVLLDVQMPILDGVETLVELQRINPAVPVAFMSATPGWFTSAEVRRLGVVQVFDKPFPSLKYLAETLNALIGRINPSE